jgi:hypothetical protein
LGYHQVPQIDYTDNVNKTAFVYGGLVEAINILYVPVEIEHLRNDLDPAIHYPLLNKSMNELVSSKTMVWRKSISILVNEFKFIKGQQKKIVFVYTKI